MGVMSPVMGPVMGPKSIGARMGRGRGIGGIGGRMVPLDGGLSGMAENVAWLSQHEELSWVLNKGLRPIMHARTHVGGNACCCVRVRK